jgi:hypothetical protein
MVFKIGSSEVRLNQTGQATYLKGAAEAKEALQKMALSISNGTSVKSGYLSLLTAQGASQEHELGLRRFGGANESTGRAASLVKELVGKAYGDQPAVLQALERYLEKSGQRIGTQSFMRLVQSLESAQVKAEAGQLSGMAAQLVQIKVRSSARLNADGFEASAGARRAVDLATAGARRALEASATLSDPVAGLARLMTQVEALNAAIQRANSVDMNVDALQANLRDLRAQAEDLKPRAALVQAFLANAEQEVGRMADAELGELRSARDLALQQLKVKADELNQFTLAFHSDPDANGPLDEAVRRHAQLQSELATAKANAQNASEQLESRAQHCADSWKQEWTPAVQAQKAPSVDKSRLSSAIANLKSQAAQDLAADTEQIASCTERFGPPDAVLADHVSKDRLAEAFAHLKELKGDGAAAYMADIARARLPQGSAPAEVAQFAARAFGADELSGLAAAQWLREAFNLQEGGAPARAQMMQALHNLRELNPDVARATISGLGLTGQRFTVQGSEKMLQPGSEFQLRLVNELGTHFNATVSLVGLDLQNSVGLIEASNVDLAGAKLAGSRLVFKPNENIRGDGWVLNLEAAASLPEQIHMDFSSARASFEYVKSNFGLGIANGAVQLYLMQPGQQAGILRVIERLPAERADLKASMMRDLLVFLKEIDSQDPVVWRPTAAALIRDPAYRADPAIQQLLSESPLRDRFADSLRTASLDTVETVQSSLDHLESLPEASLTRLMVGGWELFNQLFTFAGSAAADPSQKDRIASLERKFLNTPPQLEMMRSLEVTGTTSRGGDGFWKFEPGQERRLMRNGGLYLSTPARNYEKLLRSPGDVAWSDFLLMSKDTSSQELKLNLATVGELGASMGRIRKAFPLISRAFAVAPTDGASEVLGMVFGNTATKVRQTLLDAFKMRGSVPQPWELSLQLQPHLETVMRFKDGSSARGPVGVSREHYAQLLDHAAANGFANDAVSFARYLHCLAISFAFLSSDGALGTSEESVESLRMYALALHRESMHLNSLAPEAFKGYEAKIAEVDKMFTDQGQCGHMLAVGQTGMLKTLDPRLAGTMMPARLLGDDVAEVVGGGRDAVLAEAARNANLVREMRGVGVDSDPPVRAAMQFGRGVLVGVENAGEVEQPDFSNPDLLENELMARMAELGSLPERMGASDPIARLNAVATVHATLGPLKAALEGALEQALSAIAQTRQRIEAEKPPEGATSLVIVRFEMDRKFRLDALKDDAQSKVARQRAGVEKAIELLQTSATLLAEGPSQAS